MSAPARRALRVSVLVVAACVAIGGCRRGKREPPKLDITWTLSPSTPAIGAATLAVTVRDTAGRPVSGARVHLEGQMSHAGMAPVLADAPETPGTPGLYTLNFVLTMEGDWVLILTVTLPDGRHVDRRVDVRGVRAST